MVSNSQYALSPQSFLQESARVSPSNTQSKAQKAHTCTSPENFVTIGGCFTCYTYRVTALGCLKKLRTSDFRPFQACHFKNSYYTCCYYYTAGQALSCPDVLLDASIWSLAMNRVATLKLGHPYIIMDYATTSP